MNKKLLILAIGMCLSIGNVFAQVKIDRGSGRKQVENAESLSSKRNSVLVVKYGVKAGVTLSNMSNDMSFDPGFSMGVGFQAGAVINLHWGQRTVSSLPGTGWWGLQPEILFSRNSIKSNDGNINLNYIKVPLMLRAYPLSALSLELGPEFSYLISSSPDYVNLGDAIVNVGNCHGFNFGAGIGLSYEFNFGLMAGARYSMNFTNLGKNLMWKNNSSIQISAGWLF